MAPSHSIKRNWRRRLAWGNDEKAKLVIPARAGNDFLQLLGSNMDSGFRRNGDLFSVVLYQVRGRQGEIMTSKYAAAVAIFVLSASLSAGNSIQAVPEQFLGDWGTSLTDCGTEADDTALHIGKRHMSYHESSGPLIAVVVRGEKEVALVAELTGEGEIWLNASAFMLSPDGNQLTQRSGVDAEPFVRVRCDSILGSRPNNSKPNPLRGSA